MNLNNISLIKLGNDSEVDLIKWNGSILYRRIPLYVVGEFTNRNDVIEVRTMVNKSHITLRRMFYNCHNLTSVNTEDWDTSNISLMEEVFGYCYQLRSLDLSSWDTSKVTSMSYMFSNCMMLETVGDLSNWNTGNVTNMDNMFYFCNNLAELNISNWNTNNVKYMSQTFAKCSRLSELDLSGWNTSNVIDMSGIFDGCTRLSTLNISNFDMSKVDDASTVLMFQGCNNLQHLRLDNCSKDTISKIIASESLPTGTVVGVKRKMYINRQVNVSDLKLPDGWMFSYVN